MSTYFFSSCTVAVSVDNATPVGERVETGEDLQFLVSEGLVREDAQIIVAELGAVDGSADARSLCKDRLTCAAASSAAPIQLSSLPFLSLSFSLFFLYSIQCVTISISAASSTYQSVPEGCGRWQE
jgi:hypothetical protein